MQQEFGHFDGKTYTRYKSAKTLKQAVRISVKVALRKEGKKFNREGLQACYDEIADSMAENMKNDGFSDRRTTYIPLDELAQFIVSQGWITAGEPGKNKCTVDNSLHFRTVLEVCKEIGVVEKEREVYTEAEWANLHTGNLSFSELQRDDNFEHKHAL